MGLYNNIALFLSFENSIKKSMEVTCLGQIISLKEEKDYLDKYILKILKCNENKNIENKKIIIYVEKEKNYISGDIIFVKGIIDKPEEARNFYGFSQLNYLKSKKIYGIIKVEKNQYIKTEKNIYYYIGNIKENLKKSIQYLYSENYENSIGKILLGLDENIDEQISTNFRDAGISHVLAISGLHISYVVFIINLILEKVIYNIKIRNICVCIIIILFLIITGMSPSCTRACIMAIFHLIAQNLYRKNNVFICLFFSFAFIIFLNMYSVYNIGMWLSFLGTLGIVLFHDFICKILNIKKDKFSHKVINIILVSVSAQILLWPVVLYYFNTISLTFFISNIFISILIGPIILLGFISIFLYYICLPLSEIVVFVEEILMKILYTIAEICSKIPFSKIYIKGTNEWILILYYSLIIVILINYYKNKFKFLKKVVFIKNIMFLKKIFRKDKNCF